MEFGDFFLQSNNGKKIDLNFRGKLRREDFEDNKKLLAIFNFFDKDGNGVIEENSIYEGNELSNLFAYFKQTAKLNTKDSDKNKDNILDISEVFSLTQYVKELNNISFDDIFAFLGKLQETKTTVTDSKESTAPDGTTTLVNYYSDGMRETVIYYPDGKVKFKIQETIEYKTDYVQNSKGKTNGEVSLSNIDNNRFNNRILNRNVEMAPEAEAELREYVAKNLIDNSKYALSLTYDSGWLTKMGIDLQEWDGIHGSGLDKLDQYLQEAQENLKLGEGLARGISSRGSFNGIYRRGTGEENIDYLKFEQFRQTTMKYREVKALEQQIAALKQGISEAKTMYANALISDISYEAGVMIKDSHKEFMTKIEEVITQFIGNKEATQAFIKSVTDSIDSDYNKFFEVITKIQEYAEKQKTTLLDGETAVSLERRYQNEYKSVYGKEDVVPKIEELVNDGKALGSFVQIGLMTVATIIIGALTDGTGVAALDALIGYLETVGVDYALSLSEALTSQRGLTSEAHSEILEKTKSTAKFVGFGMVAASPLSKMAGAIIGKGFDSAAAKLTGGAFERGAIEGAVKTTKNGITKTTISGSDMFRWILVKSSEFGTELGAFTGFELMSEDKEFKEVLGEQGSMLSKMKVMNSAIQVLLGSFIRNRAVAKQSKHMVADYNKMLKESGFENAKITEHKSPTNTIYSLKLDGKTMTFKTQEEMGKAILTLCAINYAKTKPIPEEIKNKPIEELISDYNRLIEKENLSSEEHEMLINVTNELEARETSEGNKTIKLQQSFSVENTEIIAGKAGQLSINDNEGNLAGLVNYDIMEINGQKVLHFEGLESKISGKGVGTALVKELVKISEKLGAEGRLYAKASPMKNSAGKLTNIEFYYKLGFRAVDPSIDAQIRKHIENGEPVPVSLNVFTEIMATKQSITEAKLPQSTIIGNRIFELKPENAKQQSEQIKLIKTEINELKKTNPQKAEELEIILNMMTNPTPIPQVSDKQVDAVVNYLMEHYAAKEGYLTQQVTDIGLNKLGSFGHRLKGEFSTRDKIVNYLKDKDNQGKTLLDAYKDVRDKYGARTVFEKGDFTKHPEIQALLKAGKIREAELRAAELQSEPALKTLIEAMRKAKEENQDFAMMRISNYTSENGIPIFSELQLAQLKHEGAKLGINVEFIKLASEIDPALAADNKIVKGATTKQQPSGYTALQVNFVTKAGETIEWQFRGKLVNEFGEAEHLPYDLRTGKQPWAQYPELEPLFSPIAEMLSEKNMPKEAYKQLNKYFTDYYTHLRRLELGFESTEPKLADYQNYTDKNGTARTWIFDKRLEAKNLIKLHEIAESVKKGEIDAQHALKKISNYK